MVGAIITRLINLSMKCTNTLQQKNACITDQPVIQPIGEQGTQYIKIAEGINIISINTPVIKKDVSADS